MASKNEQQNLINDLKAPIKSFRIFALEEAIKSGDSEDVLKVLHELKIEEDDGECQILINYAISAVQSRLGGKEEKPAKKIKEQQEFFAQWNAAEDPGKMQLLSGLPVRLPAELKKIGPDLLEQGISSVIAAKVIRIFCRHWPEEKFKMISDLLSSNSLSLRLASLKTIVHMKPDLLLADLPTLLRSEDPQIKALAIRGLAKIDKEEALNHLQALLLSSTLSDRLAGIQNCPFLPFEMVKPVLLKYFSAENHSELLIRAGWILEMNPDIQVPFKLYEIAERSPAKKAELVKEILNEAVKLLEKSGILGDKFALYTRKLQTWVNKRNALRFIKQLVPRLAPEVIPPELDQLIRNRLNQPLVREAFTEALNWPISEAVKAKVAAFLDGTAVSLVEPKLEDQKQPIASSDSEQTMSVGKVAQDPVRSSGENLVTKVSLTGNSEEKNIKLIASLSMDQALSMLPELKALISNRSSNSDLRIAAFHSFARLKLKGFEALAEPIVTGNDVALATSALEYLGEVDPEIVFPYLGQCLKVPDVRMKSAALGILKHFDFNQAVSSLNAMLSSTDPGQQRMALECMDQFDFALIREQLTEFLEKNKHESLVEAGLCHFAANPASENVYCLYKIEKSHTGKIARQAKKLRESCSRSLSDSEISDDPQKRQSLTAKDDELKKKWQDEQERKKRSKPAYAYKATVSEEPASFTDNLRAVGTALKQFTASKGAHFTFLTLVLLAVGFYTFFVPNEGPDPTAGRGNAIVSGQYLREGTVKRASGTAIEFESASGEIFVFHPISEGYRMPAVGTKLRVSLVPYRKAPGGVFLARIRAMRVITSFSEGSEDSNK